MRKGMLCPTLHGKPANQYDKTCPRSHCWRGVGSDGGGDSSCVQFKRHVIFHWNLLKLLMSGHCLTYKMTPRFFPRRAQGVIVKTEGQT